MSAESVALGAAQSAAASATTAAEAADYAVDTVVESTTTFNTLKAGSEAARTAAEAAKVDAEQAKVDAETAAAGISTNDFARVDVAVRHAPAFGLWFVEAEGAVGDWNGSTGTDATAAIQATVAAVEASPGGGGTVAFMSRGYKITAALQVNRAGVRFQGMSKRRTIIHQVTAAADGIVVNRDTSTFNGTAETFTRGFTAERITLEGPGLVSGGTVFSGSTGTGLKAIHGSTYAGQKLDLDLILHGWQTGARVTRWDNCDARLQLEYCQVGWHSDGNANSMKLRVSGTNCTDVAIRLGDGYGVEIHAQDIITCGRMLDMLDQSQAVLHGYNFEACMGTTFVNIANGARLVVNAGRHLKSVGADVPAFTIDNGGQLVLNGVPAFSGFTTAKLVKKAHNNATVYVTGPTRSLSVAPEAMVDDVGVSSYPASPWPTRHENSVPGGSVNLRNMLLAGMNRDASNTADTLNWYGADKTSGTLAHVRYRLNTTIEGAGTPEGVVAAPVSTLYKRTDGVSGTTWYTKESGTGNTGWRLMSSIARTTAQLASAADSCNTDAAVKRQGQPAFNTTTNKPVWATGSSPTSTWVDATGVTAHTPA